MRVLIMRHGDAVDGFDDAARELSKDGEDEARAAGKFLAAVKSAPDVVWHSPLVRAAQTARLAASACGASPKLVERSGLRPGDDPYEIARELERMSGDETLMIVSHLPFVGRLASVLACGSESADLRFTTGTVSRFDRRSAHGAWMLTLHMTAKMISRLI